MEANTVICLDDTKVLNGKTAWKRLKSSAEEQRHLWKGRVRIFV